MSPSRGRNGFRRLLIAPLLLAWLPIPAIAENDTGPAGQQVVELFHRVSPAVVRVIILTEDPGGKDPPTRWAYSGFFINRDGHVLTNIGSNASISRAYIEKDGLSYLAEVVGTDARTNLALLQVLKLPEKFEVVPIPEKSEPVPVGSPVLGVTSPLEFDPSPSLGLITGYESSFTSVVFPFTYTRMNVPVGRGEGGAPVVDMAGKLVGQLVYSVPEVRSSYLVPARALARIVDDLTRNGRVLYSALPLEFSERPDASNVVRQVVVASVRPESAAARADVRPGDIVRRLGSSVVRRIHDVRDAVFFSHPGEFITLEVEREGRVIPFALPVEEVTSPEAQSPKTGPTETPKQPQTTETPARARPTRPAAES